MELTPATNEILEFSFEFQSLPAELQLEIFSWLDRGAFNYPIIFPAPLIYLIVDSLCQCAVVCHSWNDLAGNAALWKSLFKSRAGKFSIISYYFHRHRSSKRRIFKIFRLSAHTSI